MKLLKRGIKRVLKTKYPGGFFVFIVAYLILTLVLSLTQVGLAFKTYAKTAKAEYWEMVGVKSNQWKELFEEAEAEREALLVRAYPGIEPYTKAVIDASSEYNVSPIWLARIIQCESNGNYDSINVSSQATGLMQFLPSTWRTTPFADENMFDPVVQIKAGAWMASQGREREWECN